MNIDQLGRIVLRSDKTPLYLIVAGASLGVLSVMIAGFERDIFVDDAYYYNIVARQFAESGRFSFDGISETNGFHPLLFWGQVLLAEVLGSGTSPFGFYRALLITFALVLLGFVGALAYFRHAGCRTVSRQRLCSILVLAIGYCFLARHLHLFYAGMEPTLAFPLCVFTVVLIYIRRFMGAGIVGALLVSARLDAFVYVLIPLCVLYSIYEWYERRSLAASVSTFARLALPSVLFVAFFMLFNYRSFGAFMPISGALKSSFPVPNVQLHNILAGYAWLTLRLVLVGACLLVRPKGITGELRVVALAFVIVTLTQLSGLALFQQWAKPAPSWYHGLPLFTGAASLVFGVANHLSLRSFRVVSVSFGLLLVLMNGKSLAGNMLDVTRNTGFDLGKRTELIEFVGSAPSGEVWAYTDCGKLSFWGNRRFVNLDGLANNFEYQDYLQRGDLEGYLRNNGVRYLIAGVWDRPQTADREYEPMYKYRAAPEVFAGDYDQLHYYLYSYLHGTYSEKLQLPQAAEIWRSGEHKDGNATARHVVFDMEVIREHWNRP